MNILQIYLDNDLAEPLEQLAAEKRLPVNELIREAIAEYLQHRDVPVTYVQRVFPPRVSVDDPEWRAAFDAALERIRAGVPADMTPEEIEAEITAASEEVRQERLARLQAPANHG
jgi:hypothetical protein